MIIGPYNHLQSMLYQKCVDWRRNSVAAVAAAIQQVEETIGTAICCCHRKFRQCPQSSRTSPRVIGIGEQDQVPRVPRVRDGPRPSQTNSVNYCSVV